MLDEMFLKIFFRNHIYWDVFENLTFRNLPAIRYMEWVAKLHVKCLINLALTGYNAENALIDYLQ